MIRKRRSTAKGLCRYRDPISKLRCMTELCSSYGVARHLGTHARKEMEYARDGGRRFRSLLDATDRQILGFGVPKGSVARARRVIHGVFFAGNDDAHSPKSPSASEAPPESPFDGDSDIPASHDDFGGRSFEALHLPQQHAKHGEHVAENAAFALWSAAPHDPHDTVLPPRPELSDPMALEMHGTGAGGYPIALLYDGGPTGGAPHIGTAESAWAAPVSHLSVYGPCLN